YSRVSMQRGGALLAVLSGAGDRPTDLAGVARAYAPILQRRVPVPAERIDEVASYLHELRLWKRYRQLREASDLPAGTPIEVQDLWLSDRRVPSATGAITDDVVDEAPQLAASLRLLRDNNYTLTDRGKALLAISPAVPRSGADSLLLASDNPFLLGAGASA